MLETPISKQKEKSDTPPQKGLFLNIMVLRKGAHIDPESCLGTTEGLLGFLQGLVLGGSFTRLF